MKTSRSALLVLLTALVLILTACEQAAIGLKPEEIPVPGGAEGRDLAGAPTVVDEDGNFSGEPGTPGEADRSIIRTGEITVEVDDVPEMAGEVRALALELDGFISNSLQGEVEDSATLTMRIPADRFEDALAAIHDLGGEVKAEATREEDVTAVVIDMEARLENLRAAEEQYRDLLDRATEVEDVLAIQNQLFAVRGEIESMQAQLDYYTDQVALATLTVTIIPVPEPVQAATEDFDPAAIVKEAVASLVSFGQWLVGAGIWLMIVGVPALIVFGIVAFVAWKLFRRVRPASPPKPPAVPATE